MNRSIRFFSLLTIGLISSLGESFTFSSASCRSSTRLHNNNNNNKQFDIEAASTKLSWETVKETSGKPVLDLSSRDASPEDSAKEVVDTTGWDQAQRWEKTSQGLADLGFSDTEKLIPRCPQLLRLETDMVIETAEWLIQEFGINYAQSEPRFLSYPATDVAYGLELMSMMMMTDAKPACSAAPAFLLNGIEEGIRERAVKNALGQASAATYKASQNIAGDVMGTLKQLKKGNLGGLDGGQ